MMMRTHLRVNGCLISMTERDVLMALDTPIVMQTGATPRWLLKQFPNTFKGRRAAGLHASAMGLVRKGLATPTRRVGGVSYRITIAGRETVRRIGLP